MAEAVKAPLPALAIGCGGMAGAVLAALRRQSMRVVQVQNPRMDINRFDLIIANAHDELTGPNVIVVRTALHRVTPARLAEAAEAWRDRLAATGGRWSRFCWVAATAVSGSTVTPGPGWRPTWRRWRSATRWAWW